MKLKEIWRSFLIGLFPDRYNYLTNAEMRDKLLKELSSKKKYTYCSTPYSIREVSKTEYIDLILKHRNEPTRT